MGFMAETDGGVIMVVIVDQIVDVIMRGMVTETINTNVVLATRTTNGSITKTFGQTRERKPLMNM